jgi:putative protein-disulfide isomerase
LATRAIVALGEIDSRLEPKLLGALQTARYVDAKDTATGAVVASVAAKVVAEHGYSLDEGAFQDRLANDNGLANHSSDRVRDAIAKMRGLAGYGVPRLLATIGDFREVIGGTDLYGGAGTVLRAIRAAADHAFLVH